MKLAFRRPQWLFACTLLVYLAFLTRTYYWDGVLFSLDIESVQQGRASAATLFHPNHLIYNAFGLLLYSGVVHIWPGIRAITVLQSFNALTSVAAGCVFYLLARRITTVRGVPFFCWLLFAAGATWWKFSTDADVYILCVLLLLLSALSLLHSRPKLILAGVFHALAMLLHELAVFTYIPVLAFILLDPTKPVGRRIRTALAYCAGTGSVVAGAYLLCYSQANHTTYPTLVSWITSYATDSGFTHSAGQIVRSYLTSYLKLFAGGKFSLIREFFSIAECAALLLSLTLLVWAALLFTRAGGGNEGKTDSRALLFLWTWFAGYALFLGAWDPGSAFHKLFVWPAIVLLIGLYLARGCYTREHMRAFTVLVAALAAWNFGAFIYPHSHAAADPVLVVAQRVDRELPKNSTVYYRFFDPDDWYLDYFAPGRDWKGLPPGATPATFFEANTGPVCFETTALDGLHADFDPNLHWELVNGSHNIRLACLKRP